MAGYCAGPSAAPQNPDDPGGGAEAGSAEARAGSGSDYRGDTRELLGVIAMFLSCEAVPGTGRSVVICYTAHFTSGHYPTQIRPQ